MLKEKKKTKWRQRKRNRHRWWLNSERDRPFLLSPLNKILPFSVERDRLFLCVSCLAGRQKINIFFSSSYTSFIHSFCVFVVFLSLGIINIPSIQGIRNITHRNTRKALEAKCLMECFVQQIIRVIKEPTFFYWLRIAYLLETYVKLFLMNIFHLMYRFPLHFTTHI